MILYHAITNYHVLSCILHKIKYNAKKECIIYISSVNKDKKLLENNLKKSKLFKEVKIFKEFNFSTLKDGEKTDQLQVVSDFVANNNSINFENIEEFNICGDQFSLGLYLIHHGIPYNYFEEACGILSQSEIVENNVKNISIKQYNLVEYLSAFGKSDFVVNRFGDLSKQVEGYYNEKDVDFSIRKILSSLSVKQINKVIRVFQDELEDDTKGSSIDLLLTQHFINLGFMTYEEQRNLYTLLVDYFSRGNQLVIKPHPSDVHGLYTEWFPNSIVLNRTLPSELLTYCLNSSIETGITASSTALLGLEAVNNSICFNNDIEIKYVNINRYYVAMKMLRKLISYEEKIYLMGCYKQLFDNLAKINKWKFPEMIELDSISYPVDNSKRKILVVDDLSVLSNTPRKDFSIIQEMFNNDDIVIYINSNEKEYFYKEEHFDKLQDIVPILIEKTALDTNVDDMLLKTERMYFYCANAKEKEKVISMTERKKLKNSRIELKYDVKDQIEIKTLEGILKATEERLLEEVKINKELRKKNHKLELSNNELIEKNKELAKRNKHILNSSSWKITKPLRGLKKMLKSQNRK